MTDGFEGGDWLIGLESKLVSLERNNSKSASNGQLQERMKLEAIQGIPKGKSQ